MNDSLLAQVRLRENLKPQRYLIPRALELQKGDFVIVPDDEEQDVGLVVSDPKVVPEEWAEVELPVAIEVPALDEVEKTLELRKEKEPTAIKQAYPRVRHHNLDMKLVTVRYYNRSNKMKFYFSSDNRVDFRELVKDLAHIFHARIEMRQIGVRDAAGMVGGYGLCGEELCCSRFLKGFDPITIRMAKDQHLALNPSKISGCCGRLLCCLKYEHSTYTDALKHYPKLGTGARHNDRFAKVVGVNILRETVTLDVEAHMVELPLEEFKALNPEWRNAAKSSHGQPPRKQDTPRTQRDSLHSDEDPSILQDLEED